MEQREPDDPGLEALVLVLITLLLIAWLAIRAFGGP